MIFEEDAEWAMLLGVPHLFLPRQLAAMPRHWTVLQAAVIAEIPYLRHLERRLDTAGGRGTHDRRTKRGISGLRAAPMVPRATLRGLSWPFSTLLPRLELLGFLNADSD